MYEIGGYVGDPHKGFKKPELDVKPHVGFEMPEAPEETAPVVQKTVEAPLPASASERVRNWLLRTFGI
jgi:hypothetical protein